MATVIPPLSKRQKREAQKEREVEIIPDDLPNVLVKFQASDTGEGLGTSIRIPGNSTVKQLEQLVNQLAGNADDPVPYSFSVLREPTTDDTIDIVDNIYSSVLKPGLKTTEDFLTIVYTPRAVFKVKPITRSSAAISGHASTILACQFAPHSSGRLVTGAGDSTARIWDCDTQTPIATLTGHSNWVLCVAWCPNGELIATGSMDCTIRLWDGKKGRALGEPLRGHGKWISALAWEPLHLVPEGETPRLASCSKDGTVKVWDVVRRVAVYTFSGHTSAVSCVKWGGKGLIYSTSHDKTIRVWSAADGSCVQVLKAHAHWVNHISLSTEYALRIGPYDYNGKTQPQKLTAKEMKERAYANYRKVAFSDGRETERIVTASDDFTMYLWEPSKSGKPITRMTGHQKLVNHVSFSPDGRHIASASFDNSVKLWDGRTGKFISTFRGHVASVYQCAWSGDNRMLVSSSKDTTLKVWDVRTKKLAVDLPGHADEVYSVDWSVDGARVASGGKDKMLRLWAH